jgi:hypothetical protein
MMLFRMNDPFRVQLCVTRAARAFAAQLRKAPRLPVRAWTRQHPKQWIARRIRHHTTDAYRCTSMPVAHLQIGGMPARSTVTKCFIGRGIFFAKANAGK